MSTATIPALTAPPARRPALILPTIERAMARGLDCQAIAAELAARGLARGDGEPFSAADVAELVKQCDLDPAGVVGRYTKPRRPARLPYGV